MHSASKWIDEADPKGPASKTARRALAARFDAVLHYMPLAALKYAEDIEHVHQLRVATRRARAAQEIFADFLPRRPGRAIRKRLRRLRRAAGQARDLDVLGQRLQSVIRRQRDSRLGRVIPQIAAFRKTAQKPLRDACKKLNKKGFAQELRAAVKRVRWRGEGPEPRFDRAARAAIRPLVAEFFEAAGDLDDPESLHQMRIAAKRVRYAMELLAGAFDESFRSNLYPAFAQVQERLGAVNDHATAMKLFSKWSRRTKGKSARRELAELAGVEQERLNAASDEFRQWWTKDRAEELARGFERALASEADESPGRAKTPFEDASDRGGPDSPAPSPEEEEEVE